MGVGPGPHATFFRRVPFGVELLAGAVVGLQIGKLAGEGGREGGGLRLCDRMGSWFAALARRSLA